MKPCLRLVAGAIGALLLAGCAARPITDTGLIAEGAAPARAGFGETLRACRFLRGGRPGAERRQSPRDDRIRGCLARRGWQPDGTPTLASLLPPQRTPDASPAVGTTMPSASAANAH